MSSRLLITTVTRHLSDQNREISPGHRQSSALTSDHDPVIAVQWICWVVLMLLIVCLKTSDDNNIKVSVNKHKCYLKLLSDEATSILHNRTVKIVI